MHKARMILLWLMLGAFSLAALMGVLAALVGDMAQVRALLTCLLLGAFFTTWYLLGLLLSFGVRSLRWLMILGIIFAVPAFFGWCAMIWVNFNWSESETIARISFGFTTIALWALYVGYCFCMRIRYTWFLVLAFGLFACSTWFFFLIEAVIIDERIVRFISNVVFPTNDLFDRVLIATIVLFISGSFALPVAWLIVRIRTGSDTALGGHIQIALSCPRCGLSQSIPVGGGQCSQCRLEIRVKLEEPRCACGFLLYRFEGSACPECGRPVRDDVRWLPQTE